MHFGGGLDTDGKQELELCVYAWSGIENNNLKNRNTELFLLRSLCNDDSLSNTLSS